MVDNTGAPKTIGSIFAMIEGQKLDFNISEYAVSQTTLEQIFQTFANTSINEKAALTFGQDGQGNLTLLNPDRKSLFVQKREIKADISNNYSTPTPGAEMRNSLLDGDAVDVIAPDNENNEISRDTMHSVNKPTPPQEESKLQGDNPEEHDYSYE